MLLEDIFEAVGSGEVVGEMTDVLEIAQDQAAGGTEGVMQLGDHALLRERMQAIQNMAAADEIHARERRIVSEVLVGKNAHVADGFVD